MNTATVATKVNSLQACLADLHARGAGDLIEGVHATRINEQPIIRLRHKPKGFVGLVTKRPRRSLVRVMGTEHLGCQLRWEESV
jgi:hypothetical protein